MTALTRMTESSKKTAGMAMLVAAILLASWVGLSVVPRARMQEARRRRTPAAEVALPPAGTTARDAERLALAYYARKHGGADVSMEVRPAGDHYEADVRKFGFLVSHLEIRGRVVTEKRTGLREWAIGQLLMVN